MKEDGVLQLVQRVTRAKRWRMSRRARRSPSLRRAGLTATTRRTTASRAAEVCDGNDNDRDNALDASRMTRMATATPSGYDPATGVVTLDRDCNDDATVLDGSSFPVGAFQTLA